MKWRHLFSFLAVVMFVLGITMSTAPAFWKHTKLGLDLRGGYDLLYQIDSHGKLLSRTDKQAVLQAVQLRVNAAGIGSPNIELENGNQVNVQLAGAYSAQQANAIIGHTSQLKIYSNAKIKEKSGTIVPYTSFNAALPQSKVIPSGKLLVTGSDLKSNASWEQFPQQGNVVSVTFKDPIQWRNITTTYLHHPVYTFLGSKMVNYATIHEIIPNGKTVITGMTKQECIVLAKELNAGALPYPLKLISSTTVGPSLGQASLDATVFAATLAVVLIFLFMMLIYRTAGLIANVGLIAYAFVTLALFDGLGIVLTLPGLAALVLGLGMAVDANIITNERIRDELRTGKSLISSIISGNRRALRPIMDSNVTTFIAGAVMYIVGSGAIKGFAVALMLSIGTSLLTAVFLGRTMLLHLAKSKILRKSNWFGFGGEGAKS
ncbi:protein translocase subunit SecD [Alicyclobacillus sp. SO9]|uniref:protein translocase subunit SecD n=1 Tax=Alicyclobacillus sp. SO9 TaxID=2665646 RepID=UPI0018E8DA6C|nr:protein translocase subunit SecD [Alicyclobacillus sp. SO9]QQE78188.1 protein translocase subunit SecD [Alicyclobacillus sp. SO9]